METFVIILLAVCIIAAFLVPKYYGKPPKYSIAVILTILLVPLGYEEYKIRNVESVAERAINVYTGSSEYIIECDRISDYFFEYSQRRGEVYFDINGQPELTARLAYPTCSTLSSIITAPEPKVISLEDAISIHVVSHELQHLLGVQDESIAECYAMQNNPYIFELFEIKDSLELSKEYYLNYYPKMPNRYKTSECRLNGELDLQLESSIFK